MKNGSNDSRDSSPLSGTIGHFTALAESIGYLRADSDHKHQRLTQLEARQSDLSHQMARLETRVSLGHHSPTQAAWRPAPPSPPSYSEDGPQVPQPPRTTQMDRGRRSGMIAKTTRKRRWQLVLTIAEKAASIGPTAFHIIWWVATRAAGAWLLAEGYLSQGWRHLLSGFF